MNPFAIKTVFFGTVGIFAGCLTLLLGIPAVVCNALAMIAAGCILIYIGGRNLFDGDAQPCAEQSLKSMSSVNPQNAQWQSGQMVELFGDQNSTDAQTPSDRVGPIFATLGVTLMCAVGIAVMMAAELHKGEKAPVREVLDPLRWRPLEWNPLGYAHEELLISLMDLPPEEAQVLDESRRLLQSNEYEAVIKLLDVADVNGPYFGGRLFYMGCALQHMGRNQEAEKMLSEFVAVQTQADEYNAYRRETRYYRARALLVLGRPQEAEADLSFAIRIKPAAALHQLRAEVYAKLAMYEKAAADWRQAAELNP